MFKNLTYKLKNYNLNLVHKAPNKVQTLPIGERIPKIVHHTFSSRDLLPELTENIAKLKLENPDWAFKFYDDHDQISFINQHFPNLLSYYNAIDASYGAAKADFFRYLLIYKFGGVYLDIKSSLSKPLNEIINDDTKFILAYWELASDSNHPEIPDKNGEFQQWHVISVAGHPYLKQVIDNICRNIEVYNPYLHGRGAITTLRVTGPIAYSLAILPIRDNYPHTCGLDNEIGLVYSIYNANMKTKLSHRKIYKSHYSKSIRPMIKQPIYTELSYILLYKIYGKITRTWNKLFSPS